MTLSDGSLFYGTVLQFGLTAVLHICIDASNLLVSVAWCIWMSDNPKWHSHIYSDYCITVWAIIYVHVLYCFRTCCMNINIMHRLNVNYWGCLTESLSDVSVLPRTDLRLGPSILSEVCSTAVKVVHCLICGDRKNDCSIAAKCLLFAIASLIKNLHIWLAIVLS